MCSLPVWSFLILEGDGCSNDMVGAVQILVRAVRVARSDVVPRDLI